MWFLHLLDSTALWVNRPCPPLLLTHLPYLWPHPWHWEHLSCILLTGVPILTKHSLPHRHVMNTSRAGISVLPFFLFWAASSMRPSHSWVWSRTNQHLVCHWMTLIMETSIQDLSHFLTVKRKKSQNGKTSAHFTNSHRCWREMYELWL